MQNNLIDKRKGNKVFVDVNRKNKYSNRLGKSLF